MAKTYGLLAQLRRNDRILRAAISGAVLYVVTVAVVAPILSANADDGAQVHLLAPSPMVIQGSSAPQFTRVARVDSPVTVVRNVVNRPTYEAYLREKNCLATAIYFEARGETFSGQKAVAEVVLARTRVPGRPTTVCGVVYEGSHRNTGCQFSFTCDGIKDHVANRVAWRQAMRIAANVMRTGGKVNPVAGGATFYHADYVSPGWASRMVKVAEIGTHIFYRPQRGRHL